MIKGVISSAKGLISIAKETVNTSLQEIVGEKLKTSLQDEVAMLVGFNDEIEKLFSTVTLIQALLEDAESRRVKDEAVKEWLKMLKDVAYDVEDILDEWMTEARSSEAADEGDGSSTSKKRKITSFLSPFTTYINPLIACHKMGVRIKKVRGRLDDIYEARRQLGLRVDSGERERERERVESEVRREVIRERETGSLLYRPSVVGREDDKNEVLDLLLRERSGEVNEVPVVISIVGMGGLGKTTLAQLIYNDEKVQGGHFDMRMWVCVSEDFDVRQITKSIIESATRSSCDDLGLDLLQTKLHEKLQAKRFLLVLDDIWSEDSEKWEKLSLPFRAGAPGSRIIVTTRNENVASAMGRAKIHNLAVLSDDDCWLLFRRRALEHRSAEECSGLEDIGREIVRKCGGVPLAAKTIGSAMCSRRTRRQWELVLRSEIWMSGDVLGGVLPALLLSYHDLPPALKQCFTYCSVFPKDWEIEKDVMVKLWVAQGFIRSESEDMEEIGGLYFDDLLRRSLLQDAELVGDKIKCKMHDLVHDLAQSVAGSECSVVQSVAGSECSVVEVGKQASLNLNNVRHSFLIVSHEADETASILATSHEAQKLRTLLIKSRRWWLGHRVPQDLFQHLRCVRALGLSDSSIEKLPETVGQLKHLRYLDLSRTKIKELPETIGQLKHLRYLDLSNTGIEELPEVVTNCANLQTLMLNVCHELKKLPRGMRKMISLRHLELDYTSELMYLPPGIVRLTELRTLTKFIVGGGDKGCKWGELKYLNHLQGKLCIMGLQNVRSVDEAREAELYNKQNLHALTLEYKDDDAEPLDDDVKKIEAVLEVLHPCTSLKEFYIKEYKGSKLPKWIEDPVFSNLVKVELFLCDKCKQLPGLGKLPFLKYLLIQGMKEVRYVGGEFSGDDKNDGSGAGVSFPKLETLTFWYMENWEEWELRGGDGDGEVMPSLIELSIGGCRKLKELPSNLPPILQKLSIDISNEGLLSGGPLPVLPNLNHLLIWYSHELTSIPGGWLGQLKSLKTLEIHWCQELRSLPEEELQQLTMLQELMIIDCPLLKERYREGGEDRHKIAHIPRITFIF